MPQKRIFKRWLITSGTVFPAALISSCFVGRCRLIRVGPRVAALMWTDWDIPLVRLEWTIIANSQLIYAAFGSLVLSRSASIYGPTAAQISGESKIIRLSFNHPVFTARLLLRFDEDPVATPCPRGYLK